MYFDRQWFKLLTGLILLCILSLTACTRYPDSKDPYEGFNRKVFAFNQAMDTIIMRPIAKTYVTITPVLVQQGVGNFYDNFWSPTTVVNDLLQAKFGYALSDTWRFLINSTVGLLGLIDVASHLPALPKHYEDLGLTFAYWGAPESAYFQIPFFGASTYRDVSGRVIDTFAFSFWPYIKPNGTAYAVYSGYLIDARASILPADKLIKQAFDPYIFVRNAYFQYREKQIEENKKSYSERIREIHDMKTAKKNRTQALKEKTDQYNSHGF
jgi:phospholipid-binding lipoprotein MlaA